ncbi:MAG: cob(I)yrinic acid a,c-diamide adenosyltransferase [PVC group bacterium]
MIHIYTGDGKGKTTAALGLALRSLGWGKRVCLIQFLKMRPSGEIASLTRFENCRVLRFGSEECILARPPGQDDRREAQEGLDRAEEILREKSADLLILDEINLALDLGLLDAAGVLSLIAGCPPEIELVLTGRNCPGGILSRADYVSEIREVRHPYRKCIAARQGVEY